MAFLVTGGTSQVGTVVARLLKDDGKKVIISSRSGRAPDGYEATKLDWADISTIDTPFISGEPIQGVYIMAPPGLSASETIVPFIDKAVAHGVKRFVLLSGSAVEKESDFGKVWKYLDDQKLDYFVLRPTAFTDNFHQFDGTSIRESNQFTTAMPNAKIPFISAVDIGELAFRALTNEKNERSDQYVIGPELLTYDQAAEVLSKVLGRKITHNVITGEQMSQLYTEVLGIPLQTATFLVKAQLDMDAGSAERLWGNSEVFVGKETLKVWAERNKSKLAPASSNV